MKKWHNILLTITLAAVPISQALAVPSDPMIEGAKLCTRHLPRYEREYAIPTHLLSAIASTESGRYHEGLGMKLPWPWAINAGGKGYYFETKEQAIAAVRRLRAHGVQSIDVGCMQVNLYQHPDAFANLSEAFEPQSNIAYAAGFLRSLYNEGGTWKKAASNYHSRTPSRGREYVSQVYDSWYTIIDRLRAARLQVPESSVTAMNELKSSARVISGDPAHAKPVPHVIHVASVDSSHGATRTYAQAKQDTRPFEHTRMNSIRITSEADAPPQDNRAASNILVIPAVSAQETPPMVKVADAAPAPVVASVNAPLTAAPVQAAVTSTPAVQPQFAVPPAVIRTADNTPLTPLQRAALQTPVQTLTVNPTTGHTSMDANTMGALNPSAGRHVVDQQSFDRSGPNFIFND